MSDFIAEYVSSGDGGPTCMRADCIVQMNGQPQSSKDGTMQPVRCLSCGKTWMEKLNNGTESSSQ